METRPDDDPSTDPTEEDRRLLEDLGAAQTSGGRRVTHRLAVPTREAADALAAIVLNERHDADVRGPTEDSVRPWLVLATSQAEVSDDIAAVAQRRFEELAAEHGGRYEGADTAGEP